MELGNSAVRDLGPLFSSSGSDFAKAEPNTGMHFLDMRYHGADLISFLFRYERGYKVITIDIGINKVIYASDLRRESPSQNRYAFMASSIVNVTDNGRRLFVY